MLKTILTAAFVFLLLATVALLVSVRMFITGAAGLDDWVMRQALIIAETYLVPKIKFDNFNFSAPSTMTYTGVRLVAPDGTQVIDADELIITLGELPQRGEPIVIQGVTIRNGSLHLIADPTDPQTTFKGLAPFVKTSAIKEQDKLPSEVRLSETLDLRTITLDNASVIYDLADGRPPMRLDGLFLTMNVETDARPDGAWHSINLDIDRGDLFRLVVDGRFSLDTLAAELDALLFRVDVGSESVAALPPQLQQILADYDARGNLEINLTGATDLKQWRQSELIGAITIDRFNVALGEYRLPVDHGAIPIKIGGGSAALGPARLELLHGLLLGNLSVNLQDEAMPAVVEWSIDGLDLRDLLRTAAPEGEPPKIAGILRTFGSASMDLTRLPDSIDGRGELHITEGRLIHFPGVRELNDLLDIVAIVKKTESRNDTFDAVFTLTDQAIRIESSTLETNSIVARGTGLVYYNQSLDLRLNAGPMEKVQSMLGKVGEAIGQIMDQLVKYRITGTMSEPELAIEPLGVGL